MFTRVISTIMMTTYLSISFGCCCGPGSCGYGVCPDDCYNCDDVGFGRPIPCGPFQHFNQMRRSFVCGGGCGEVYYGEWTSTPPDACDPCCGERFAGGAVPCQPFCWRPGTLLFGFLGNLYGRRFCDGCGVSIGQCGCDGFDGGGHDAMEGSYHQGAPCATCDSSVPRSQPRFAQPTPTPPMHRAARFNAGQRGVSSSYSKQPTQYR